MLYLLAIILPPVAVLLCAKPITAVFNLILCLFLWIPGVIHALVVVSGRHADKRTKRLERAIRSDRQRSA